MEGSINEKLRKLAEKVSKSLSYIGVNKDAVRQAVSQFKLMNEIKKVI